MAALDSLKARLNGANASVSDELLTELLESAKAAILARRCPFGYEAETLLEPVYADLQIRIALDLFNKIGAEGENAHAESGVTRTYESSWISESLLREVVPKASVIV